MSVSHPVRTVPQHEHRNVHFKVFFIGFILYLLTVKDKVSSSAYMVNTLYYKSLQTRSLSCSTRLDGRFLCERLWLDSLRASVHTTVALKGKTQRQIRKHNNINIYVSDLHSCFLICRCVLHFRGHRTTLLTEANVGLEIEDFTLNLDSIGGV